MMPVDIVQFIDSRIEKQTQFLRHYYGQVLDVNDPLKEGRVLVTVPELGWFDMERASWASPRGDFRVPEVNDYVEIYFMGGLPEKPVYLGITPEMNLMLQKSYDGKPTTKILFDDKVTKSSALFQQEEKLFKVTLGDGVNVNVGTAAESFVKGDTAKTELQKDVDAMTELQSAIGSWVPIPNDGGAALQAALAGFLALPMASLSAILSERIKGE